MGHRNILERYIHVFFPNLLCGAWESTLTILCYTNALRLCHEDYFALCRMLQIDSSTVFFNF